MRSNPQCRPTSSMRSASRATSTRNDGHARRSSPQPFARRAEAEAVKMRSTSASGTGWPSNRAIRARRSVSRFAAAGRGIDVGDAAAGGAGARLLQQRQRPRAVRAPAADVGAALEPHRCFGLESELACSSRARLRAEPGALERDARRPAGNLRRCAAHHAGERDRAIASAITSIVSSSVRVVAVERGQLLARARASDVDLRPASFAASNACIGWPSSSIT